MFSLAIFIEMNSFNPPICIICTKAGRKRSRFASENDKKVCYDYETVVEMRMEIYTDGKKQRLRKRKMQILEKIREAQVLMPEAAVLHRR